MPVAVSQLDRNGTPRVAQQPFTYVEMEVRLAYEAGCAARAQHIPFVNDVAERHWNAGHEVTIRGHGTVAMGHHNEVGLF